MPKNKTEKLGKKILHILQADYEVDLTGKHGFTDAEKKRTNQILKACKEAGLKFISGNTISFNTAMPPGTQFGLVEEIDAKE